MLSTLVKHDTCNNEDALWLSAMEDIVSTIHETKLPVSSMKPITLSGTELGTTSTKEQYQQELQAVATAENIHLSLCGGMGADVFIIVALHQ